MDNRRQEIEQAANRLIRKYDWKLEDEGESFKLTVTDGQFSASEVVESSEDVEKEVESLVKRVDDHRYTVIGNRK